MSRSRNNPSLPLRRARIELLESKRLLAVTYQGGPLIDHAAVETIYLGTAWTSDPSLEQTANRLDQFFAAVTNSSYLDMLSEYSTPQGGQIGRGSFTGRLDLPQDSWTASVITLAARPTRMACALSVGQFARYAAWRHERDRAAHSARPR